MYNQEQLFSVTKHNIQGGLTDFCKNYKKRPSNVPEKNSRFIVFSGVKQPNLKTL